MSNINLPRVPPAKPPSLLSLQRTKLLIVAALVAVALVGGRALLGRGSPEARAAAPAR